MKEEESHHLKQMFDPIVLQQLIADIVNRHSEKKIEVGMPAGEAFSVLLILLQKWELAIVELQNHLSEQKRLCGDFTD